MAYSEHANAVRGVIIHHSRALDSSRPQPPPTPTPPSTLYLSPPSSPYRYVSRHAACSPPPPAGCWTSHTSRAVT